MATESTATELNTYISTNFVSGTGAFKLTTLVTLLENLIASIYVAISKTNSNSITAGAPRSVAINPAFSAGSTYQLIWWAYDADGNQVACKITSMTVSAFYVEGAADCTFHWFAIKNN